MYHNIFLLLNKGKGMLIFLYVIVCFLGVGLLAGLVHDNTGKDTSNINMAAVAGIAFILAAAWTYLTKDNYYKDREGNRQKMDTVNSFIFIPMKIWAYLFGIAGLLFIGFSFVQTENKSRVAYFNYGGYGDTSYAALGGKIFRLDTSIKTKDSLVPLPNVTVRVEENNKTTLTDSGGSYGIWFEKGVFTLLITKDGYQPLRIKNYESHPDQFSEATIYLEKGNEEQVFEVPKHDR